MKQLGPDQNNEYIPLFVTAALIEGNPVPAHGTFPRLAVGTGSRAVFFLVSPTEGYATTYGCSLEPGFQVRSLEGLVDLDNPEILAEVTAQWNEHNAEADELPHNRQFRPYTNLADFSEDTRLDVA